MVVKMIASMLSCRYRRRPIYESLRFWKVHRLLPICMPGPLHGISSQKRIELSSKRS